MFFFLKLSVGKLLECLELVAGSTLSGFLCDGYKFFAEVNLLTGAQLLALGNSILALPAHSQNVLDNRMWSLKSP